MRNQGEYAIDLTGVEKTYKGKVHALRGVTMQVHAGEIFGLLGPNGAGKSTLVKIMMTVIRPTRANGTLLNQPVGHKPTLARVGYLPEHHVMPKYLTGAQVLEHYGALAGVDRRTRKSRSAELMDLVGMTDWARKKMGSYSKGMQQRVGLAQAMINDPDLIVLDEPTDGVDPVGRRDIRDILLRLREKGTTVFLNSHLLSELEMVCHRVSILVQGNVAMQGTLDELTADSRRYEIVIAEPPPDWAKNDDAIAIDTENSNHRLTLRTIEANTIQPVLDRLRAEGKTIVAVRPVRETLEDLFMRAVTDPTTGKTLLPGAASHGGTNGVAR